MGEIGTTFISGIVPGFKFDANKQQNYNHYYLEQETLYNHNHDGQNSSDLISGVNTGTLTVDNIELTEYMSFTDLFDFYDSGWFLVEPISFVWEFFDITRSHGLGSIPNIIHVMYTKYTSEEPPNGDVNSLISGEFTYGIPENYTYWRVEDTNRGRNASMTLTSINNAEFTLNIKRVYFYDNEPFNAGASYRGEIGASQHNNYRGDINTQPIYARVLLMK